ncbi:hypothetical protein ASA1KI_02090 [Opitutales bacterium ASA1]|uniref:ribbon-helix-helix domain-containing protein n=1 Tax=Congregicoccus parvus TaxID=3081749 RepID=UPI002B2A93CD|nr:hypothetical protein ASA1KI_02090 [Opitutales bacterium ASA1]
MASPGKKAFLLRIDPRLWAELEGWAQQELRSVNGQIEFLLREAVRRRRKSTDTSDEDDAGAEDGAR